MIDIKDFYDSPYLNKSEFKDLVLFCYNNECQFDKIWTPVTKQARGIIFNKISGEIVARPWQKFFNIGETPDTLLTNLPEESFTVTKKIDGSLGILFNYENEWYITTKGSFYSNQAKWATEWIRKNINLSNIKNELTYLFEIVYPENKIVVDYGKKESLILLGCIEKSTGKEINYQNLLTEAKNIGSEITEIKEFLSLEDLVEYCKILPSSEEGFVVTFQSGLKVKIKGDEYTKLHKIISNITPLAFWDVWDTEKQEIPKVYLSNIPEEFEIITAELTKIINKIHFDLDNRIKAIYSDITNKLPDCEQKEFAIFCEKNYKEDMPLLMNIFRGKWTSYWSLIHRRVRPKANIVEGYNLDDRIKRILDDN